MALANPTKEKEKKNNKMSQDSVENCISKFLSFESEWWSLLWARGRWP